MTDRRGRRAWIKVQMADSQAAHEASALVAEWKTLRQAAGHLVKAVHLYAALCRGDVGPLYEYFPGIALGMGTRTTIPRKTQPAAPTIIHVERSETEELSEALDGLGLDNLDFS